MSRLTGKTEFQRLRGLLQASTGRDFERLILPMIRFLVPNAFGAPALGEFDKLGIDLLAWKGPKPQARRSVQGIQGTRAGAGPGSNLAMCRVNRQVRQKRLRSGTLLAHSQSLGEK